MSKAFGEENPTEGEDPVSWQTWDNGAAVAVEVVGDADWGKMKLDFHPPEEGRSAVYDLGSLCNRKFTITENRYGTGTEDATIYYRGSANVFAQDALAPLWTPYIGPTVELYQYVQVMVETGVAAIYYVDATLGDDGNDGLTPATAWETIAAVNAAALVAGDHVLFKAGETFAGALTPATSGAADHPIVYGAYGNWPRPIIDGSNHIALGISDWLSLSTL